MRAALPPPRRLRPALVVVAVLACAGPANAAPAGLAASYGFEGGAGATVADGSGNANTGTIAGATWTTAGRYGKALSFDGVNDLVSVADSASLDLTTGMTLEGWLRPTALGGAWRTALMKEQSGGVAYAIYANSGAGRPGGYLYSGGERGLDGPAALPLNAWTHVATTYDGATQRLYVNGAQVASRAQSGAIVTSASPLRIGGNNVWGEWFSGQIDEVRVYNRALSAAEVAADRDTAVGGTAAPPPPPPPDTTPPSAPGGLRVTATGGSSIGVAWNAASDNVGVAAYGLYRNGVGAGSTTSTAFTFTGLACGTTYTLGVQAGDAAGNQSTRSTIQAATSACADTTAPAVSIMAPTGGATVSGTVNVSATASDNVGVAGVQFKLNGANLGAEDTSAPYGVPWNTTAAANGSHTLTAVARDAAGNTRVSAAVPVTVNNAAPPPPPPPPPPPSGLVAAYSFDADTGTTVTDASGRGNTGVGSATTSVAGGRFGKALSFNGSSSSVRVADSGSLDVTGGVTLEAWVNPRSLNDWRSIILKEGPGYLIYELTANGTINPGHPTTAPFNNEPNGFIWTGGEEHGVSGSGKLPLNTWSHLAVTYDGSALVFYVNGVERERRALSGPVAVSNGDLRIGGNSLWGEYFDGLIDNIRIYNTGLSASQVQANMNRGI